MAKLQEQPIAKDDIVEYLNCFSDFAFEIAVLRQLVSLGFICEHAGTYEDPVTQRTREFDIRARKRLIDERNFQLNLSFSVECKNLRENFPLVVHCMPREERECFVDLIWASEPENYLPSFERAMRVPLYDRDSPYEQLMAVGKSCDQVGRRATKEAEIIGNDGDVFEKISQAINAGYDLIEQAHYAAKESLDVVTLVVPVLVVPDERIWSVWYNRTGEVEREPTLESNVEYYLGKSWLVGNSTGDYPRRYYFSHLEIIQIQNIADMVNKYARLSAFSSTTELNKHKSRGLMNK